MEADPITLRATERSYYKLWTYDKLRYSDLDRQGHVNNAVYATFFETGRVHYFHDPELGLTEPGSNFVVARVEIDYRAELHYPGTVDIGIRTVSVGRTSFRLGEAVFKGEQCIATAQAVVVMVDDMTRKSRPLSPRLRAWLEGMQD
jgi:acyl-CoA thioester hydrolase